MAYIVRRKINGRVVEYRQETYRVGRKVKTRYLGPVAPKRKRRGGGGLGGLSVGTFIMGALTVVAQAATGRLGPPGGRPYPPVKNHPALYERSVANKQLRELYAKYQIDVTHPDKMDATFDRLPKEMQREAVAAQRSIISTYLAARERGQQKTVGSQQKSANEKALAIYKEEVSRTAVKEAVARAEAISPGVTEDGAGEKGKE